MRGLLTKHQRQKQVIARLKNENENLRNCIKELEKENKYLRHEIETLKLQLEELTRIIFGGKNSKGKKSGQGGRVYNMLKSMNKKKKRGAQSYQRPLPSADEVTEEEIYEIDHCNECGDKSWSKKKK